LLTRRIGLGRAKELILTGKRISGEEAFDIGLVQRVVDRGALQSATMDLAREICASSPIAVQEAKKAIDRSLDVPVEEGIELEDLAWRRAVASEDRREGIAAFNEKRSPEWKGR
jgi:enoyl-CoA hydratase/carnithine racemase